MFGRRKQRPLPPVEVKPLSMVEKLRAHDLDQMQGEVMPERIEPLKDLALLIVNELNYGEVIEFAAAITEGLDEHQRNMVEKRIWRWAKDK